MNSSYLKLKQNITLLVEETHKGKNIQKHSQNLGSTLPFQDSNKLYTIGKSKKKL